MKKPGKEKLKALLKLLGPTLFFIFLFRVVDGRAVVDLLKTARLDMVLVSGALFLVLLGVLTVRWQAICRQLGMGSSYRTLFEVYYAAWFLGSLPLSGTAAVAKIIYLKDSGESAAKAAVSIILDKISDMVSLMLFALFGVLYLPADLFGSGLLWFLGGSVILITTIFVGFSPGLWKGFKKLSSRYLSRRLQRLESGLETNLSQFWAGFNPKTSLAHIALAIAIGLLRSLVLYVLALSLSIQVSFLLIVACRAFIGIVNIIPVSISGLGTRDAVLLLVLPLFGVSLEAAFTLGFTAFLWTVISKLSGAIFWFKRPLPFHGITEIGKTLFSGSNREG